MSTSNTSIMSVGEMIDSAFGDPSVNVVNHKLLQTILFLLARQLRILERRVEVEMGAAMPISSSSSLSVTEVTVHAMQKKKKRRMADSQKAHSKTGGTTKSSQGPGSISDKTSSSKDKSSSTKSTTEKTTTETSSSKDKSSSTKSTTEKTTTETSSSKDKSSSSKSMTEKTTTETEKTTTESSSSKDKSSSYKSTTDKTTTDTATSTSKSADQSGATQSADKSTTAKAEALRIDKTSTKTSKDYRMLLEEIEEQRERELRVIHQRKTSREVQEKTPTPMASLDSVEAQYEKLLIVERVPKDANKGKKKTTDAPRLSVVTQEQFSELYATVQELVSRFAPIGMPQFPENIELMEELRKNASLTDAMAALQLAARLEAAEKTLRQMLSLVTELAAQTGIDIQDLKSEVETEILLGAKDKRKRRKPSSASRKSKSRDREGSPQTSRESIEIPELETLSPSVITEPVATETVPMLDRPSTFINFVTYEELDSAMQELYDEIRKTVTGITTRSTANADNAFKIVAKLEGRLEASLNLGDRMEDLEAMISEYADKVNALDTGLSSQMTNYQEQLTQMQHDLETGLETMAEQLANTETDTTAVAELNSHFTNLQQDLDISGVNQRELKDNQRALAMDLENLWKQIELLRETKSDRDEVADALRDKAGIGALNGLVSLQQFDAVRGDFEKRIGTAYDKFNNQEIIWQKAIDDLLRELNDKADWIQVASLRDGITKYLDMLNGRIDAMLDIVGEPHAAAITRRLHRDATCISCATPAWMEMEESTTVPALPAVPATRPPTIGAEGSKPKEDGDHGSLCYPGRPIPHPRDVRAHYCQRFCGGSHTLINNAVSRSPPGIIISPLRKMSPIVGTDGKVYQADGTAKFPCKKCNLLTSLTPEPTEAPTPDPLEASLNMTPSDLRRMSDMLRQSMDKVSVTPPPPLDSDF